MLRSRSVKLIAGVAVATLALAACSSNTPAAESSAPATSAEESAAPSEDGSEASEAPSSEGTESAAPGGTGEALEVGLAFDTGGRGDGTFNDSAGRGADRAKEELGVTVTEVEAQSDDDRDPNLTLLSGQGLDPIIAVGFLWSDTLAKIAAANPDTTYAIVDGFVDAPNVKNLGFAEEQGSFLVGAAAALKSTDGKIGFIGGQDGALIKKFEAGYTAGAQAVNPDIEVSVQYLGPEGDNSAWGSPDKAKAIAKTWYDEGVDIIYSAAGGSGQGTIDAAIEAGEGKWAIGVDSDQYLTASPEAQKVILTSMLKRVDEAVFQTIEAAQNDDLDSIPAAFDLSVDGVGYSTEGGYIDDIVPQLEEFKAQIIDGTITVPTS